jgi:hypothetical protein
MATTRLVVAITMASMACRPGFFGYSPRFVVTSEPLRTHDGPGVGLCFAIEASEPAGVWWWGPGKTGCTTRNTLLRPHDEASTGLSALFHPPDGKVTHGGAGTVEARFRLGLHNREQRDFVDVVLIASTESVRSPATGMSVAAKLVDDINIPFSPP